MCAPPVVLWAVVQEWFVEAVSVWPVSCGQTRSGGCCQPLLSTPGVRVCEWVVEALFVALDRWRR